MYDKLFLALLDCSAAHAAASKKLFAELSLTKGQPKVLYILRRGDGLVQKRLAELCGVRESTLTVLLSKIEKKGLIRRERRVAKTGRAAYFVSLTEAGREKADRLEEGVEALEARGLGGMTEAERGELMRLLWRAAQNLRDQTHRGAE